MVIEGRRAYRASPLVCRGRRVPDQLSGLRVVPGRSR